MLRHSYYSKLRHLRHARKRLRDNTRVELGLRLRDNTRVELGLRLRDNTRVGLVIGRAAWTPRGVHALRGKGAKEPG